MKTLTTGIFVAKRTAAAGDTVVIVMRTIIAETESIAAAKMNLRGAKKMLKIAQIFPFVDSTLDAEPGSSFSFPSFSCGYQNRACFDIL